MKWKHQIKIGEILLQFDLKGIYTLSNIGYVFYFTCVFVCDACEDNYIALFFHNSTCTDVTIKTVLKGREDITFLIMWNKFLMIPLPENVHKSINYLILSKYYAIKQKKVILQTFLIYISTLTNCGQFTPSNTLFPCEYVFGCFQKVYLFNAPNIWLRVNRE
jgi:hypothetical protein